MRSLHSSRFKQLMNGTFFEQNNVRLKKKIDFMDGWSLTQTKKKILNIILLYHIQTQTVYLNQNKRTMDSELLEEVQTVQKYLSTLFDCLPQIHFNQSYQQSSESIGLQNQILNQNISYGKKIIQLSDKFTAKYRKDHFVDRKDIEQKILQIFQYFCPSTFSNSLDDMVTAILRKLEEGGFANFQSQSRSSNFQSMHLNNNSRINSINNLHHYGTKEQKVQFYRDEADINDKRFQSSEPLRGENYSKQIMTRSKVTLENMPLNTVESQHRKRSTNKSKMSKNSNQQSTKEKNQEEINWGIKKVLQIKTYFQEQEAVIRKIFQKLNKITLGDKNSLKISDENREYTKVVNDSQKDTIKDYVHANIQNNKFNLSKIFDYIQLLQEHFEKKNKFQGLAQGKFTTYIQEINKRQELFSFTVSKLLQNLTLLRQVIEKKIDLNKSQDQEQQNPFLILDSLQQISHNFYNLYPSHSLLKDLKIQSSMRGSAAGTISAVSLPYCQKELQKIGYISEGVQVSIGVSKEKSLHRQMTQSKRNLLELFKANARMNQMIQKFERSIKYKKNVQLKQIDKFIECIRDIFSKKGVGHHHTNVPESIAKQAGAYQEELKRIIENNEKNQKQLSEQYMKKCKKYEKQIQQLEKSIEQLIVEHKKEQQKLESSIRKQSKKLEGVKQENKKILSMKNTLQRNVKEMSLQMDQLQKDIRQQYINFERSQKALIGQNVELNQCIKKLEDQKRELKIKGSEQSKKFQQQREIYQKKIIFLESQEEERNEEASQIREELQEMIKNNKILKKQIQELTEVYEQKIKQLEELIENIKQLQDELKNKNLQNLEFKEKNRINQEIMCNLQRQNIRISKQMAKLEEKYKEKQSEAQKFKEFGSLNESDINILKQQMDKVKEAYVQSQEQLDEMRHYVSQIQSQKDFIMRENRNLRKQVQNYSQRMEHEQITRQKLQKEVRTSLDEVLIKKKQLSHYLIQAQQGKKQISKLRKQLNEVRESAIKYENQFRSVRQQLQKKTESQSIQTGRRKLQLEAAKVQLRRKTQQIQKMKENYDQKIDMLESKNKQLTQFITQKQLLAKITTNHLSQ